MNNKSKIQLIREALDRKNEFRAQLANLLETYHVVDNIFSMTDGVFTENTRGYFICEKEYADFNTLFENMSDSNGVAVRIINDNKFQVGKVYEKFSDCPQNEESIVLRIETREYTD